MSVVIETTAGDLTVDLFLKERPRACQNFLKLCKLKYYNFNLFHTIQTNFIAQTGDPTGEGNGGESVWGLIEGKEKRFFEAEYLPKIRHSEPGLLSMVSLGDNMIGSQFFFSLGSDQTSLDGIHCVIGQVVEGLEVLRTINDAICDDAHRPYKDIRITHTVILDDPFENPRGFREPSRSPSPTPERLRGGRIAADEDLDEEAEKDETELSEMRMEREAKARATILEIIGDLPDAEIAPPENVLFICKLNSVTTDDDLEIIFSRFGKIKGCEVIRDRKSGDSLQYAFIEFEDKKACEMAYFKMDNVLIDDRRIHVDFSQSVSRLQWRGKGRGMIIKDGNQSNRLDFDNYKKSANLSRENKGRRDYSSNRSNHIQNRRDDRRNDARRDTNSHRSRSPRERNIDNRRDRGPYQRGDRSRDFDRNRGQNRQKVRPNERSRSRSRSRNRGRHDFDAVRRDRYRSSPDRRTSDKNREERNRNDRNHYRQDDKKSERSKRSSSTECRKEEKLNKKTKKSKRKHKKDKSSKKKKSNKKHKKRSSSESSSDSDSSTS